MKDTLIHGLVGKEYQAELELPIPQSFDTANFVLQSCKNNHSYELKSLKAYRYREEHKSRKHQFKGREARSKLTQFVKASGDGDMILLIPEFKEESSGEIVSTQLLIGINAPPLLTCYYHLRFYDWDWNYCSMIDTILVFNSRKVFQKDSMLIDTSYFPNNFFVSLNPIEYSFRQSFDQENISVTSAEDGSPFEVIGFKVVPLYTRDNQKEFLCIGSYLSKEVSDMLDKCKPREEVAITNLKFTTSN